MSVNKKSNKSMENVLKKMKKEQKKQAKRIKELEEELDDLYYSDSENESSEDEDIRPTKNGKNKKCKCGSSTHFRTNHKDCPLNKNHENLLRVKIRKTDLRHCCPVKKQTSKNKRKDLNMTECCDVKKPLTIKQYQELFNMMTGKLPPSDLRKKELEAFCNRAFNNGSDMRANCGNGKKVKKR